MKKIQALASGILMALTPIHSAVALEPIITMMELQQGDLARIQFATSRCGALFMSVTSRIESELAESRGESLDQDVQAALKVAEQQLEQIKQIRTKFVLWDQALSKQLGQSDTAASTSMINRAMQYDRHRQAVYIPPGDSFSQLEKQDVQTCGAIEKMLSKES